MRRHKLSARHRVEALEALKAGETVAHICATLHISPATLYGWKQSYAGLSEARVAQLDALMRDKAQLGRRIAVLEQENSILQKALGMQALGPEQRSQLIIALRKTFGVSMAKICRLVGMSRTFFLYEPVQKRRS